MTQETQLQLFEQFVEKQKSTITNKAHDYSGTEDVLKLFKESANNVSVTGELVCLMLIQLKVSRLGNLLKEMINPKYESIDDSILDLANYAFLLHCLLTEKNNNSNV